MIPKVVILGFQRPHRRHFCNSINRPLLSKFARFSLTNSEACTPLEHRYDFSIHDGAIHGFFVFSRHYKKGSMKFGEHSLRLFARIGCELPPLPYKNLKQRMTDATSSIFFFELASLVGKMERAWKGAILNFRLYRRDPARVHRLVGYAQLCHEGIRKLVKKYNKRHPGQNWVIQNRRCGLLGGSVMFNRLKRYADAHPFLLQYSFECPVCLEGKLRGILLACEHRLCLECAQKCQGMPAPRTCPVCRLPLILIPS